MDYKLVKRVSDINFIKMAKPGDVILSTLDISLNIKKLHRRIYRDLLLTVQHSPFSSSKMYVGKNMVVGYGAIPNTTVKMSINNFYSFKNSQKRLILLRPDFLTYGEIQKSVSFMLSRLDVDYNFKLLMETLLNRIFKKLHIKSSLYKDDENKYNILLKNIQPLICSNIIALSYYKASVKTKYIFDIFNVWPKDFYNSYNMKKVCYYER